MTLKEFCEEISGKEYGYPQFTDEEIETAEENGFVIVYGYSDDCIEFDGAIRDEAECFGDGKVYFDRDGIGKNKPNMIEALWDRENISWIYQTEIPHDTFMIYEGGELFCVGIVFDINDLR